MTEYFLDTYALVEIFVGNPEYEEIKNSSWTTSMINLAELSVVLRRKSYMKLESAIKEMSEFVTEITADDCINCGKLKSKNKKLSLADALGYSISQRKKKTFVTGDSDFKNFKNVKMIK